MDDDMTHPSQIPLLLDKVYEGWDVVYARYENGLHESLFDAARPSPSGPCTC